MATKTKAIVSYDTHANGGWRMEDVTVRAPGEGELLVEMVGSGICHTDVLVGGLPGGAAPIAFYPRVLGHEGGGYVKSIGPGVTVAEPGDPVLLSYAFCQSCAICTAGHHSHCPEFAALNFAGPYATFTDKEGADISGHFFGQSSFAHLSVVKQCSVVNAKGLVRDRRELQLFSPLGCGIQTGAGTIINAAKATPDDIVVVMGLGGVGLSAIMAAKIQRCRMIIGLDRVPSRLALAHDLGATHTINGSTLDPSKTLVETVKALAEGHGPTVTVDTTGVPALIRDGIQFTRNCGRILQVGSAPFDFNLELNTFEFMMSGKQFLGAIEGQAYPPEFVPRMIGWYREGRFPIERFMKLIPAGEFELGLREMHDGTTIKPILCWS
ncbi:NAD(P)-binding protein [Pseudovirgaria hyperparasitica]|uniref:NAD(P)-binding protein n=1 Tax=Pseudovirgaria hyperparasitica TaxID=470096 RepID=A0A6A6W0G9_9PEZI|nr:NAD(P)-binding protein [Pseudovirgaria hyperparasitica]KAF2756402.1 NAD(P)-binding protein [Pseudovirgaria hyperparasitica]